MSQQRDMVAALVMAELALAGDLAKFESKWPAAQVEGYRLALQQLSDWRAGIQFGAYKAGSVAGGYELLQKAGVITVVVTEPKGDA